MVFLIDNMFTFRVIFKLLPGLKPYYQKPVFLMKKAPNLNPENDLNRFIRAIKFKISRDTSCMEVQNGSLTHLSDPFG